MDADKIQLADYRDEEDVQFDVDQVMAENGDGTKYARYFFDVMT